MRINRVFVFINGFWWGLYPWDYYPYYAYGYPYDYDNSYPYDYDSGYSDSYYDSSYLPNYHDQASYSDSQQPVENATVGAVQSELAQFGYYRGAIDGVVGGRNPSCSRAVSRGPRPKRHRNLNGGDASIAWIAPESQLRSTAPFSNDVL